MASKFKLRHYQTQADIEAVKIQANKSYANQFDYEMDLGQAFAAHRIAAETAKDAEIAALKARVAEIAIGLDRLVSVANG